MHPSTPNQERQLRPTFSSSATLPRPGRQLPHTLEKVSKSFYSFTQRRKLQRRATAEEQRRSHDSDLIKYMSRLKEHYQQRQNEHDQKVQHLSEDWDSDVSSDDTIAEEDCLRLAGLDPNNLVISERPSKNLDVTTDVTATPKLVAKTQTNKSEKLPKKSGIPISRFSPKRNLTSPTGFLSVEKTGQTSMTQLKDSVAPNTIFKQVSSSEQKAIQIWQDPNVSPWTQTVQGNTKQRPTFPPYDRKISFGPDKEEVDTLQREKGVSKPDGFNPMPRDPEPVMADGYKDFIHDNVSNILDEDRLLRGISSLIPPTGPSLPESTAKPQMKCEEKRSTFTEDTGVGKHQQPITALQNIFNRVRQSPVKMPVLHTQHRAKEREMKTMAFGKQQTRAMPGSKKHPNVTQGASEDNRTPQHEFQQVQPSTQSINKYEKRGQSKENLKREIASVLPPSHEPEFDLKTCAIPEEEENLHPNPDNIYGTDTAKGVKSTALKTTPRASDALKIGASGEKSNINRQSPNRVSSSRASLSPNVRRPDSTNKPRQAIVSKHLNKTSHAKRGRSPATHPTVGFADRNQINIGPQNKPGNQSNFTDLPTRPRAMGNKTSQAKRHTNESPPPKLPTGNPKKLDKEGVVNSTSPMSSRIPILKTTKPVSEPKAEPNVNSQTCEKKCGNGKPPTSSRKNSNTMTRSSETTPSPSRRSQPLVKTTIATKASNGIRRNPSPTKLTPRSSSQSPDQCDARQLRSKDDEKSHQPDSISRSVKSTIQNNKTDADTPRDKLTSPEPGSIMSNFTNGKTNGVRGNGTKLGRGRIQNKTKKESANAVSKSKDTPHSSQSPTPSPVSEHRSRSPIARSITPKSAQRQVQSRALRGSASSRGTKPKTKTLKNESCTRRRVTEPPEDKSHSVDQNDDKEVEKDDNIGDESIDSDTSKGEDIGFTQEKRKPQRHFEKRVKKVKDEHVAQSKERDQQHKRSKRKKKDSDQRKEIGKSSSRPTDRDNVKHLSRIPIPSKSNKHGPSESEHHQKHDHRKRDHQKHDHKKHDHKTNKQNQDKEEDRDSSCNDESSEEAFFYESCGDYEFPSEDNTLEITSSSSDKTEASDIDFKESSDSDGADEIRSIFKPGKKQRSRGRVTRNISETNAAVPAFSYSVRKRRRHLSRSDRNALNTRARPIKVKDRSHYRQKSPPLLKDKRSRKPVYRHKSVPMNPEVIRWQQEGPSTQESSRISQYDQPPEGIGDYQWSAIDLVETPPHQTKTHWRMGESKEEVDNDYERNPIREDEMMEVLSQLFKRQYQIALGVLDLTQDVHQLRVKDTPCTQEVVSQPMEADLKWAATLKDYFMLLGFMAVQFIVQFYLSTK